NRPINNAESGIFAPFALANADVIYYNKRTEHRAQSTEHRAQSTEHRAQSTVTILSFFPQRGFSFLLRPFAARRFCALQIFTNYKLMKHTGAEAALSCPHFLFAPKWYAVVERLP
ncbi:MAG: hypothetical protein LBO82_05425, partial [Synergistaceae bacterium]|nr:hypothetical protein [Synergistaceae bacterium]